MVKAHQDDESVALLPKNPTLERHWEGESGDPAGIRSRKTPSKRRISFAPARWLPRVPTAHAGHLEIAPSNSATASWLTVYVLGGRVSNSSLIPPSRIVLWSPHGLPGGNSVRLPTVGQGSHGEGDEDPDRRLKSRVPAPQALREEPSHPRKKRIPRARGFRSSKFALNKGRKNADTK